MEQEKLTGNLTPDQKLQAFKELMENPTDEIQNILGEWIAPIQDSLNYLVAKAQEEDKDMARVAREIAQRRNAYGAQVLK